MRFMNDIPIEIDDRDVFRLLGCVNEHDRKLDERFARLYEGEKRYAKKLMQPRAVFVIKDFSAVQKREIFNGAEKIALSLTTIGSKLEERVSQLSAMGHLERSVVLDAIGSAAMESVANFLNEIINQRAEELGYDYTCRFSPGYCFWDISDQRLFFDLLPADQIGVKLTQSMMMVPRKSVTFAVNLGRKKTLDMGLGQRDCGTCNKADCRYRRQEIREKSVKLVNRESER